ncbi:MAG: pseudouridine-5'-phosphate glycosidase [Caldisericia bacterium]
MKRAKNYNKETFIFSDEFKGSCYPHLCFETTLISFGLPYPENLKIAKMAEDITRKNNIVPLTIGIKNGKILIGIKDDDFDFFAKSKEIIKVNMRDIPYVLSTGKSGALTISGMLFVMNHLGLKFLASGGLGGIHRDFETTFDISSDLTALSKYKTVVITSGFKSILDIKKTWELLETLGVIVIGYNTDKLPGFYFRETDINLNYYFYDLNKLVDFLHHWEYFSDSSVLIVNPIPKEDEIDKYEFEKIMEEVEKELKKKKIIGKDVTPFLLNNIHKKSKGKTIKANKSLILSNAKLGSEISKGFFEL